MADALTSSVGSVRLGRIYEDVSTVKKEMEKYNNGNNSRMVISKHDAKCLKYECCRGRFTPSKSKGKRLHNHYFYTGCEAEIRITKHTNGNLKVTYINEEHNHEMEDNLLARGPSLTDHEVEYIQNLIDCNLKPHQITKVVKKIFDKTITEKKVRALKLLQAPRDEGAELRQFLQEEIAKGGHCSHMNDDDGNVKALFI